MSTIDRLKSITDGETVDRDLVSPRVLYRLVVLGLLLLFIGVPFVFYVWGSFWTTTPGLGGHFTVDAYRQLMDSSVYQTVGNTLIVAVFGTAIALFFGVTAAVTIAKTAIPGKNFIATIFLAQYLLPGFVLAIGWEYYLQGPNALINQILMGVGLISNPLSIYNVWGIVLVTGIHYSGLVYLLTYATVETIPRQLDEAAKTAGAGTRTIVTKIILKLSLPAIVIAGVLVFTRLMQSMGIPLILGLPGRVYVLATRMFIALTAGYPPEFAFASAMGMIILVIAFIGLAMQMRIAGASEKYEIIGSSGDSMTASSLSLGKWRYPYFAVATFVLIALFVMPVLVIIYSSFQDVFTGFTPGAVSFTTQHYETMFFGLWADQFWPALRNTIFIGFVGPAIAMVLASFASYIIIKSESVLGGFVNFMTLSPAATPAIVVATAVLWFFLNYNVLGLYNTIWLIVVAFTTKFIVLGTRATNSAFRAIGGELEDAAQVNGAGLLTILRKVYFPLIKPGFLSGYLLLAILYMKVLVIPLILGGNKETQVLATLVWLLRGSGNKETSAAAGVIMFVVIAVGYLLVTQIADIDLKQM